MLTDKKNVNQGDNPFVIQQGRLKHGKITSSYRLGWTEDAFIMDAGRKDVVGRTISTTYFKYLFAGCLVFIGLLFGRTAWLQVAQGDYYYKMAEGNRIRIERIDSKRGIIFDRHGKALVRNQANFMLYLVPSDLPKDDAGLAAVIKRVSQLIGPLGNLNGVPTNNEQNINEASVESYILGKIKPINRKSIAALEPVFIADNLPYEKALALSLESTGLPGVVLSSSARRQYNVSEAASLAHVLGYTGKINDKELAKVKTGYQPIDYIGKSGLENYWESELRGGFGQKQVEVDAMGKEKRIISIKPAVDGQDLILSLDYNLQAKIEQITKSYLSAAKLSRASVVAMDPRSGEVLAMVSLPAYDDNIFARGISQKEYDILLNDPDRPLYNRSMGGEFPSGSTIKPVISAAALQEGIITESTTFLSNGGLRIDKWFFPDWKAGGHGMTNVRKAIAESVNTFFYIIGGGYEGTTGLGVDRLAKYFKLFGLGSQTGIDLPGEVDGFVPSKEWKETTKKENWYIGDTYHLAIGQGDLNVTPLQVANYTAYFANGGKLLVPHLVKEIRPSGSQVGTPVPVKIIRSGIVNPAYVQIVREGMRQTVVAGSARSLQQVPVPMAGKTGTAQWSTKKDPHAWFTGFAPYDDPTIVITILVEEGKEGSTIAVPIAREVLQWYFASNPKISPTSTPAAF